MPDGPPRRLILPVAVPETAARILALAGWAPVRETMRGPARAGDILAAWRRDPAAPGEVGLEPLHLGDPGRIAGLRLHPGADGLLRPLSRLLDDAPLDDTALLDRARDAMARMRHWGLATAPAAPAPPAAPATAPPEPGYVLVLDEPAGASPRADLLEALFVAQEDLPHHRVLVVSPPEGGQIRDADLPHGRATRVADGTPLPALLAGAVAVYTVAAPLGFDAILAGHRPVVLGRPFYAGRGLTDDRAPAPPRRPLTRAQLFAAAMILAPLWYDPHRDALAPVEDAISAEAALARAAREDRAGYVAAGMRLWKRGHLARMLGGRVRFESTPARGAAEAARLGRPLLLWGLAEAPREAPLPALRLEDGFLRSRGLGARLVPPLSLARDDLGIHYDPTRESRLERLIAEAPALPPAERRRAEALVARIVRAGVTKYAAGGAPGDDVPDGAIVVSGQVEDDAAILAGAGEVRSNRDLLQAVRAANPGRTILYKPHPDVVAGLRRGAVPETEVLALADRIVIGDPATLLRPGVEVWTITSLMGFEALLRGHEVTTLGAPFYAGWGLTRDLGPVPARRTARPGLAGLAHAALIGYPRYLDPRSGLPCPPEVAVDRLAAGEGFAAHPLLARLQGLRATLRHP